MSPATTARSAAPMLVRLAELDKEIAVAMSERSHGASGVRVMHLKAERSGVLVKLAAKVPEPLRVAS